MSDKIVKVEKNGHANLDSFPFRYGFSQSKDFQLLIIYSSKPIEQIRDNKKRLKISNARFHNPTNTDEPLQGDFVLTIDGKFVVTVIPKDEGVEKSLSKALRIFREFEYVQVDQLINYFHPLYKRGDIKTHRDFKKYWIDMNSDNPEKIAEMESAVAEAFKELDKEKAAHEKTKEELQKEKYAHKITKDLYKKLQQIVDSRNEEVKKEGPDQRSKEFPDVDWNKSTVTSAIFEDWCVIGDFLCVYLFARDKPIRLKNTFISDYAEALRVVKTITTGYLIDYVTKGSDTFPTDEWFYKIINIEHPMSDVYSLEEWEKMVNLLDEPFPDFPERNTKGFRRDGSLYDVINDSDNPYCIFRARNSSNKHNLLFEKYAQLLREQSFISGSIFTIQGVYLAPAPLFVEYFGHIWNKPMLVLETDKGWFVDTTVKEHGGTYWKENETYHNCRVSMTKEKDKPYWLQKKADVDNIPL